MNNYKKILPLFLIIIFLNACNGKIPGADARKIPYDPNERVKKNLEEGKGFRLDDAFSKRRSGNFEFATANELWRASLDTIDFMPIATANYSGGILITDWYSENENSNESIKISIRFLTNEVRSDALDIKIFYKRCENIVNCKITQQSGNLKTEITKEILKKAAVYASQTKEKNFRPYTLTTNDNRSGD
tara:strand:- start:666 stop:1232 length:567 start_codon:yes stop_codon:yes gene_type:complete